MNDESSPWITSVGVADREHTTATRHLQASGGRLLRHARNRLDPQYDHLSLYLDELGERLEPTRLHGPALGDPQDQVELLRCCRLCLAVKWLGWSESSTPPVEHAHDWAADALAAAEKLERLA